MSYETIRYEVDDRVAVVTFNRPERMNAFSAALCAEVRAAVRRADDDEGVRVIVVTGAGDRAFSAGYDIRESVAQPKRGLVEWRAKLQRDLEFTYSVWECSKPVIAMISGHCLGGGLEFAQMCDLRYAADHSTFALIETRFAGGIATQIMPWILGPRCRRLVYTGDRIGADEAFRLGLIDGVFPREALRGETMKVARRMSRVALPALQWNKRAINQAFETMGFRAAMQYGLEACAILDSTPSPESETFDELRRTRGLGEAVRWRDGLFAPYE